MRSLSRHARVRTAATRLAVAVLVAAPVAPLGAQPRAVTTADSVTQAVQSFYTWYVPRARAATSGAPWMLAVRARGALFAPAVVAALRRDSAASARHPEEVVGLDGDPFLNAQDPCERYVARRTVPNGQRFRVEVVGQGGCGQHTRPDVVVEVARANGGWRFENFRYLDPPDDLLALLRRLPAR